MYYNDVMLCYGITEDELKQAISKSFKKHETLVNSRGAVKGFERKS